MSLLEQSLDNIDDDNDDVVTKHHGDSQAVTRQAQSSSARVTVHTALDVETASGIVFFTCDVVLNLVYCICILGSVEIVSSLAKPVFNSSSILFVEKLTTKAEPMLQ